MFKNLSKGLQVYILEKKEKPKYIVGTVISVSEPRFQQPNGQYQVNERLVDLTIKIDKETKTYTVGENQTVAYSQDTTLSCTNDIINNELNSMIASSKEALANVDKYKMTIEECEQIIKQINPAFAQNLEQEKKLSNLESEVKELNNMIKQLLKAK